MGRKTLLSPRVTTKPLTPERWNDFVALFGPRGACGGCWCMTPRLSRREYERQKGDGNKRAMKRLIDSGTVPGLLVYIGRTPVGWCAIERRETFRLFATSRVLAPVDTQSVWSIACLFVAKEQRGQGIAQALVKGAVAWARKQGASIIEAYPIEPTKTPMPPVFAWPGIASTFLQVGFVEVARRSPTRPIMRYTILSP